MSIVVKIRKLFRPAAERAFADIPVPLMPGKENRAEAPIKEYVEMESAECLTAITRAHKRNLMIATSIVFVLTIPDVSLTGFVIAVRETSVAVGILYWVAAYEFLSFCFYGRADFWNWRKTNLIELLRFHNRYGTDGYAAIQNLPNRFDTLNKYLTGDAERLRDNFREQLAQTTKLTNEAATYFETGNRYIARLSQISRHSDFATLFRLAILDAALPIAFFLWTSQRAIPHVIYLLDTYFLS